MVLNINSASATEYSSLDAHTVDLKVVNSPTDQDETEYFNERFSKDWGYFFAIPKLKSAIIMKSVFCVGKGYTCDSETKVILDHINGNGKQTFAEILFALHVGKQVGRDSFAEIIRDEDGQLLNLKILDPSSIKIIFSREGTIKRYELINKISKKIFKIEPQNMFHLSNNCFAGQMHGISVPESVEKIILADDENFDVMKKIARFQAVPFIIFKMKTDDTVKISSFKEKIKNARKDSEDMMIPDDENLLSWEVVQVNPSSILMEWRQTLYNDFYAACGMPLVLFGGGGTEANGKTSYLGHETVFEHDQLEVEQQIEAQLGLKINLISPATLLENLQTDETKDSQNPLTFQENDVTAGSGK